MKSLFLNEYKKIIADGAMGTYFSQITGKSSSQCEISNINNPEIIKKIHKEYIASGARFIRTNTFAANTISSGKTIEDVLNIISEGYKIAVDSAIEMKTELDIENNIFIAADIGPIYHNDENEIDEDIINEYKKIIDKFIENEAGIFIFETFAETNHLNIITNYLKEKNPDSIVIASFAFNPDGYTRKGIYIDKIIDELDPSIDIFGMNCGCGPTHMLKLLNNISEKIRKKNLKVSCMPNAGYASIENNRTVYASSPEYFAEITTKTGTNLTLIIGGCCGTTPNHIKQLNKLMKNSEDKPQETITIKIKKEKSNTTIKNNFARKLDNGDFVILAEFTPPADSDLSSIIDGAYNLKNVGADMVTFSDSPLARVKMDSIITAAKIKREVGIETLPHICCRDRNINSLRAAALGAHAESIRSILAVTGDVVPENERDHVKSVFNVSSAKLMNMISEMNINIFKGDEFIIGGALNPTSINKSSELKRSINKVKNGCRFFLTQPIYSSDDLDLILEVKKYAKVIIGIMPIVSYRNASYLKNEVPGFVIPDKIVNSFSPDMSKEEAIETGINIAVDLAEKIRTIADGFYFVTPFNRSSIICDLIKRLQR